MSVQHATVGDTVYFYFGANDTSGSGGDGASAAAHVRLAGAAASAAPVLSPTPDLLTHASYPAGCYEVAVACTVGNGFAADSTYGVFCTLAIDSQNPTGFIGQVKLFPIQSDVQKVSGSATVANNIELDYDGTGYAKETSTIGLSSNTKNSVADHIIRRDLTEVEASADGDTIIEQSAYTTFATFSNSVEVVGGALVVYRTDGTTTQCSRTAATTSTLNLMTSLTQS